MDQRAQSDVVKVSQEEYYALKKILLLCSVSNETNNFYSFNKKFFI